ncbi:MAG: DUF4386 family protein [Dehalococcoidia bacterium]
MSFFENLPRLGGWLLIGVAVTSLVYVITGTGIDTGRDEIADSLRDLRDNKELFFISRAAHVLLAVLLVASGVVIYRLLGTATIAALGAFGFIASGILSAVTDAAALSVYTMAVDLEEGGAGGAGEPEILEVARAIGFLAVYSSHTALTFLGAGLICLGVWMVSTNRTVGGWLGVVAGIGLLLVWLEALEEDLFFVALAGGLLFVAWLVGTAVTLLRLGGGSDDTPDTEATEAG